MAGAEIHGVESLLAQMDDIEDRWSSPTHIVYVVGTNVEYAVYVEFGTDPHEIVPRRAQSLKFRVDGRTIFTDHVNHPGTEAQPFLEPNAVKADRQAPRIVGDADSLEEAVREIAKFINRHAKMDAPVKTGNLMGNIRMERL